MLADELAKSAEQINWPRLPELKEFEQMAEMVLSAGYYSPEELADASSAERAQLYKILSGGRAGWARLLRKILDATLPAAEVETEKFLFAQGGQYFRSDPSSPISQRRWRASPPPTGSCQHFFGGLT